MTREAGGESRGWLAAVAGLLVEPAACEPVPGRGWAGTARPVVAVSGLGRRSGVTTVARALGAELALRDPAGAAVVTAASLAVRGIPLGTVAAGRLARALGRALPEPSRAVGRLCLIETDAPRAAALGEAARAHAPVVIDVPDPAWMAAGAVRADAVVLVGTPTTEPALAAAVSASAMHGARAGAIVVLNRDLGDDDRWAEAPALRLPEARLQAQLALAGRETRSKYGRGIALLADCVSDIC